MPHVEVALRHSRTVLLITLIFTVVHSITLVNAKDTAGVVITGDSVLVYFTTGIISVTCALACLLVRTVGHVSSVVTQGLGMGTTLQPTPYTATIVTAVEVLG